MKTAKKIVALVAMFTFLVIGNQAFAQSTTTTAEGTVLTPISLSSTILNFGAEIFPGSDKSVASTAAEAAQFDISGEPDKTVNTSFTLPTEVSDGAGNTMPISFGNDDAGHAAASTSQDTQTGFDPGTDQSLTLATDTGELYIWLGGTVSPANNQTAGDYSGDITLDVSYPSN